MSTAVIETESDADIDTWPVQDFDEARQLFYKTKFQVSHPSVAKRLWKRRFKESERKMLGSSIRIAIRRHGTAVEMWRHVRGGSLQKAVIEIGKAIGVLTEDDKDWLLREAGEPSGNPDAAQAEAICRDDRAIQRELRRTDLSEKNEDAQSEAIVQGGLVVERSTRSVYWDGELIEVDWLPKYREAWEFLILACEHAQRNEAIDRLSFGEKSRKNIVTQKKSRLSEVPGFPIEIIDYFQNAGARTQKFAIPQDKLHIFE